ncbi:MAG: hypothetical protein ACI9UK_000698 [Candidatus Krumholzibacteriia bacterium]
MINDDNRQTVADLKLGWSDFASTRHLPQGKHSWFDGTPDELLEMVAAQWGRRRPGAGREDLFQVVIVPVEPSRFVSNTVRVDDSSILHATFNRRQDHEEGFVRVTAEGPREEALHAAVVLYSAQTLLENDGARSGDYDWEVVCLLAGPTDGEPMDPLTMARNMLEKPGGTYCSYSAEQLVESIWYWAARAGAHVAERKSEEANEPQKK